MTMQDIEVLMMDALDGAITPQDQARLDAYLATHPDARAMFDAMRGVDAMLSEAPPVRPPVGFAQTVMTATRGAGIARPVQSKHVAFLVSANVIYLFVFWGAMLALAAGAAYMLPAPVFAVLGQIFKQIGGGFAVLFKAARVTLSQPAVWAAAALCMALMIVWVGALTRVYRPARALSNRMIRR
jgi:anti-sigma factor RsiW